MNFYGRKLILTISTKNHPVKNSLNFRHPTKGGESGTFVSNIC